MKLKLTNPKEIWYQRGVHREEEKKGRGRSTRAKRGKKEPEEGKENNKKNNLPSVLLDPVFLGLKLMKLCYSFSLEKKKIIILMIPNIETFLFFLHSADKIKT